MRSSTTFDNKSAALHGQNAEAIRGAGDEPTVVLGTLILETGQPLLMPADMEMDATPAA